MKTALAVLIALAGTTPAFAQYYDRPYERAPSYDQDRPPPGYYPDRDRPRPDFERERDREDQYRDRDERGYRRRRVALGSHCEVFVRTGYGPQRLFCPIVRAKPVGEECACPSSPDGSYASGRTVP